MSAASKAVVDLLRLTFADGARWPRWPKPLHLIQGALLVEAGTDPTEAARIVGTTRARVETVSNSGDPVGSALGVRESDVSEDALKKLRRNVGQLVLGRAAEIAFEDICRAGIDHNEFAISDLRTGRTNTDYRLLNGSSRPLYRFDVKFFGSVFRRGAESYARKLVTA
jgi:hypothetical protein